MTDHTETRVVLWGRHDAELIRAQRLDAKAERREKAAAKVRAEAAECRRRADYIKQAAEVLGSIDGAGS